MATTTTASNRVAASRRTVPQTLALITGLTFLLVGVAGFIPGITTNVGDMKFAGHESPSELLGIFQVSILHNLVHLAFGVAGLMAAARGARAAAGFLIGGGAVYLALWIYGLVIDLDHDENFVPFNDADNWLHLGLGVGMIALGLIARALCANPSRYSTPAATDRTTR